MQLPSIEMVKILNFQIGFPHCTKFEIFTKKPAKCYTKNLLWLIYIVKNSNWFDITLHVILLEKHLLYGVAVKGPEVHFTYDYDFFKFVFVINRAAH